MDCVPNLKIPFHFGASSPFGPSMGVATHSTGANCSSLQVAVSLFSTRVHSLSQHMRVATSALKPARWTEVILALFKGIAWALALPLGLGFLSGVKVL